MCKFIFSDKREALMEIFEGALFKSDMVQRFQSNKQANK